MATTMRARRSDDALFVLRDSLTTSHAITFLPDDPPRLGALVVYDLSRSRATLSVTDQLPDQIEVVLPNATGGGARRHTVSARRIPVSQAILFLRDLKDDVPGAAVWSAAFTFGLGLIARGRLFPSVTTSGWDSWRVGPLDYEDRRLLSELSAAFPPAAHAFPLDRSSPLRLRSPESLIVAAWDALADTLPRTAAARRNRVTLGERQLRLGSEGRWYPLRKDSAGRWIPDGAPITPMSDYDEVGDLDDEVDAL